MEIREGTAFYTPVRSRKNCRVSFLEETWYNNFVDFIG